MADDSEQIGQDEIEELLRMSQATPAKPAAAAATKPPVDDSTLGQNEIEALLSGAGKPSASPPAAPQPAKAASTPTPATTATAARATAATPSPPKPAAAASKGRSVTGDDVNLLLAQAEQALASVDQPSASNMPGLSLFEFHDFAGSPANSEKATIELLRDVELDLKIELGRTHMYLEDVLKLRKGSVVSLDKLAGDPVDIYVNGRLIARGEVLVLNDNFCVRVAELLAGEEAAA